MVSLTCYGGVGEVGGNKFLLRDGEHGFFLDFGIPFSQHKKFYEEFMKPRPGTGLLDLLVMGLLPPLKGIYRPDLELPGLWERVERLCPCSELNGLEGVLLSHAHLDHSGYISLLSAEIPIYASAATALLAKAIQDGGRGDIEREVCYFSPRTVAAGNGVDSLTADSKAPAQQRQFFSGDTEPETLPKEALSFWESSPWRQKKFLSQPLKKAGATPLPLRCFPVDHSIAGACAWAVETAAGWVAYTGDIRFHGFQRRRSEQFVHQASLLRPRALLVEGTYIGEEKATTEKDVYDNALKAINSAAGSLVIADFAARDMERLLTFLRIAQETGRMLVVMPADAYLLRVLHWLYPQQVPDVGEHPHIYIYRKLKVSLQVSDERLFTLYPAKVVSAADISRHQGDFLLCFSYLDLNELPSIYPAPGSLYLYSSSEPHDEEQELDFYRLHNWLDRFSLRRYGVPLKQGEDWVIPAEETGLHASGHASAPRLLDMVREIHPRTLIPIHTRHPGRYRDLLAGTDIEVLIPRAGEELPL